MINKLINRNKVIFQNFTYITLLELFNLISPLITYPYLVKTLGSELYGLVITSQVVATYAVFVVNFGFKTISAKDISINRNNPAKLSEIISTILSIRIILFLLSFFAYISIVLIIPQYSSHFILFLFAFGITFHELLFPQFFFQGIEKMQFITFIQMGISVLFIILIFIFIEDKSHYIYVPLLKSIGYIIGGSVSLFIIFYYYKIEFLLPKLDLIKYYLFDAVPVFGTQMIASIKDKLSYILIGFFIDMNSVVIYDLGVKFTSILSKPVIVLSQVLLPKISREKNFNFIKKSLIISFGVTAILSVIFCFLLPYIIDYFFEDAIIDIFPIRVFLMAPVILSISTFISVNIFIAFGYNKFLLYSMLLTSAFYILSILSMYLLNLLNTVLIFVSIAVMTYLCELFYKLYLANTLIKKN